MVGIKYSSDIVIHAFGYYAISQTLYNRLRDNFQLTLLATLERMMSKVSKLFKKSFLLSIFNTLNTSQKGCIILHDEVYVKKMSLYHGKQLFGKSVNNPSLLAQTVLGIMLICFNRGPKFLTKLIPISKFLFEQSELTFQAITSVPVDVKAIICDGNWVNQPFFKLYPTLPEKPWLTEDNKHLLFDYVHLLKNIHNLWLTEKTELIFDDNGVRWVAKWAHLIQLYQLESERLVKLSDLNEISIAPKRIERQQVSTCLECFVKKHKKHFSLSQE